MVLISDKNVYLEVILASKQGRKQRSYLNLHPGIRFAYNGFLQGLTLLNQSKNPRVTLYWNTISTLGIIMAQQKKAESTR